MTIRPHLIDSNFRFAVFFYPYAFIFFHYFTKKTISIHRLGNVKILDKNPTVLINVESEKYLHGEYSLLLSEYPIWLFDGIIRFCKKPV